MPGQMPRCVRCRVNVDVGQSIIFRTDGRVEHVECTPVMCPVCALQIDPGTPIRRDGEALLHSNCWIRQFRAAKRAS